MKRFLPFLGFALAALAFASSALVPESRTAEAAVTQIDVGLSGLQAVPAVVGPGSGFARLTFDDVTNRLTFAVTVSGLSPDQVTAAHIHRGALGVNGPI